ncbi:MAG: hypothetical protein DRI65_11365 [Chloroflexota bacterium]|nr:MAG: hypothetical protein DRI65_11365 [Chloroflexota bacterium]
MIVLTDTEWMSIIDRNRDGLPICCANVSELRDIITRVAQDGGRLNGLSEPRLREHIEAVEDAHDFSPVMLKVCKQLEEI